MSKKIGISLENSDDDMIGEVGDFTDELISSFALEELVQEISSTNVENNRTLDTIDGLIDTKTVVDGIEVPTDNEINLLKISANMASSGTDMDSTQLVPVTEGLKDYKQLSVELNKRIETALESLGTSHLSMWKRFKLALSNFFNYFSKVKNKLAEVKHAVEFIKTNKPDYVFSAKISDPSGIFHLTEKKQISNMRELNRALSDTADICSEFSEVTTSAVKWFNVAEIGIFTQLKRREEADKTIITSFQNWKTGFFTDFSKLQHVSKKATGSMERYEIKLPLGNRSFLFTMPDDNSYDANNIDSIYSVLTTFNHDGVTHSTPRYNHNDELYIDKCSHRDVEDYIQSLEKIVKAVLDLFGDDRFWNKIYEFEDMLDSSVNKVSDNELVNIGLQIAENMYKSSNRYQRLKTKQIDTIITVTSSIYSVINSLMNANFSLINKIVKEKNWIPA